MGENDMPEFLKAITSVTGPLTLIAFLSVIFLAAYRYTVINGKGLDYLYKLLDTRMGKKDFYKLLMRLINLAFVFLIIVTVLSLAVWVLGKIIDSKDKSKKIDEAAQAYEAVQNYKADQIDKAFQEKIEAVQKTPTNANSPEPSESNSDKAINSSQDSRGKQQSPKTKTSDSKLMEGTEHKIGPEQQLIRYLESRSAKTVRELKDLQIDALKSRDAGHGLQEMPREELIRFLESGREEFKNLHKQHVKAIKDGNYILARDILKDIHHLLYVYSDLVFHEAEFDPEKRYSPPPKPAQFQGQYPGELDTDVPPQIMKNKLVNKVWIITRDYIYAQPEKERIKKVLDRINKIKLKRESKYTGQS
jgi:hypothetical protein